MFPSLTFNGIGHYGFWETAFGIDASFWFKGMVWLLIGLFALRFFLKNKNSQDHRGLLLLGMAFLFPFWMGASSLMVIVEDCNGYNVLNHGVTGNGSTDDTANLNTSIKNCINAQRYLILPGNHTYKVCTGPTPTPLQVWSYNAATTTFSACSIGIYGYNYKTNTSTAPVIEATSLTLPAMVISYSRGVKISGINFSGPNSAAQNFPNNAFLQNKAVSWITSGVSDLNTAPEGGIIVDPFPGNNTTPANAYTWGSGANGTSAYYAATTGGDSAYIRIENCQFSSFDVAFGEGINGRNDGNDSTVLSDVAFDGNKTDIAEGSSQADGNICYNVSSTGFYCFFDAYDYGSGNGTGWTFIGGEINTGKWLIKTQDDFSNALSFNGIYSEGLVGIGFISGGTNWVPVDFNNCTFGFVDFNASNLGAVDQQLVTGAPLVFTNCNLSNGSGGAMMRVVPGTTKGFKIQINNTIDGENGTLNNGIDGCMMGTDSTERSPFIYTQSILNKITAAPADNNLFMNNVADLAGVVVVPGSKIQFNNNNSIFTTNSLYNNYNVYGTSITLLGVTSGGNGATFVIPTTDSFAITVGDVVGTNTGNSWSSEDVTEGLTTANFCPFGQVASIDGTGATVVINQLPQDFTTSNTFKPTVYWIPKWHNFTAFTLNSSTTVVGSCSDWKANDHVSGIGIPNGDRVSSVFSGSASMILTKAATSTTTSYLYDATFQEMISDNGQSGGDASAGVSTAGSTGFYQWSMPSQSPYNKVFNLAVSNYTNPGVSVTISFPTTFTAGAPNTFMFAIPNITPVITGSSVIISQAATPTPATGQGRLVGQ